MITNKEIEMPPSQFSNTIANLGIKIDWHNWRQSNSWKLFVAGCNVACTEAQRKIDECRNMGDTEFNVFGDEFKSPKLEDLPKHLWRVDDGFRFTLKDGAYYMDKSSMNNPFGYSYRELMHLHKGSFTDKDPNQHILQHKFAGQNCEIQPIPSHETKEVQGDVNILIEALEMLSIPCTNYSCTIRALDESVVKIAKFALENYSKKEK